MLIQIIRLHARQLARSDVLRLPSDRCARTRWKDGLNWLAMVSGLSTLLGFLPDAHDQKRRILSFFDALDTA
jgi:hypothetical protein